MLRWLADIAGVVGGAIALLVWLGFEPNALDKVPENLKEEAGKAVEATSLEIDEAQYFRDGNQGYLIYLAAQEISYSNDRDSALLNSIDVSLSNGDFNIALTAAGEINYGPTKDKALEKIARYAVQNNSTIGYAIIAAELTNYKPNGNEIINFAISALNGEAVQQEVVSRSEPNLDDLDPTEFSHLQRYKLIFEFADSSRYMDLSEEEAKDFTDAWLAERTFEEFLVFRKIYIAANGRTKLNLDDDDAREFAEAWMSSGRTLDDLDIYTEAYRFAYSSANMDLSHGEAIEFAEGQLLKHLKANADTADRNR